MKTGQRFEPRREPVRMDSPFLARKTVRLNVDLTVNFGMLRTFLQGQKYFGWRLGKEVHHLFNVPSHLEK